MFSGKTAACISWVVAGSLLAPILWLLLSLLQWDLELWSHVGTYLLPRAITQTSLLLLFVTVLVLLIGIGFAWAVVRFEFPGRAFLQWALVLPLALPAYIVAFVYIGMLDYSGPLQTLWRDAGFSAAWFPNVRSVLGAAIVLSLVLFPYVYLISRSAFLRFGSGALDAGRMLGVGPVPGFFKIVLPMTRHAWFAGLSLVLLETLADFGAVKLLGIDTLTTTIYALWFDLKSLGVAAQLSSITLLIVIAVLLGGSVWKSATQMWSQPISAPPRKQISLLPAWLLTVAMSLVVVMAFFVPVLQLVFWAVEARAVLPAVQAAIGNTVLLSSLTAVIVVLLSLLILVSRYKNKESRAIQLAGVFSGLGYAVPGTVLAVAAVWLLSGVDQWFSGLSGMHLTLSTSILAVLLALACRFYRVAYESGWSAFAVLSPTLLDSAKLLGASRWKRIRNVSFPVLRPGLLAALLLVFVETMKELPATLMLRPTGWDTLAVKVFLYTSEGLWQQAAYPALCLVLVGLLPVWWLTRQQ